MMFREGALEELWSGLHAQGLRAAASGFGIFWGMLMLVVLLGVGRGISDGTLASLGRYAKNTMLIWEGMTSVAYRGEPAGRPVRFAPIDLERLQKRFPEIQLLSPRTRLENSAGVTSGSKNGPFAVYGVLPDYIRIQYMRLSAGRFFDRYDDAEARKLAVIGERVRATLLPRQHPIGAEIRIRGVVFRVVGVVTGESLGDGQAEVDEAVFVPHSTMLQIFRPNSRVDVIALGAAPEADTTKLGRELTRFLALLHGFDPADSSALWIYDHEEQFRSLMALFAAVWGFVWLVGLGTLAAGVVGVSNMMLVAVRERTREFGIRKALGATPRRLLRMVVLEAVLISGAAGYLGVLAGMGILRGVRSFGWRSEYFENPRLEPGTALLAVLVLMASGVAAGLVPGLRAARIRPVEALRRE